MPWFLPLAGGSLVKEGTTSEPTADRRLSLVTLSYVRFGAMGSPHEEKRRRSVDSGGLEEENNNPLGSGRHSPLSVSELPMFQDSGAYTETAVDSPEGSPVSQAAGNSTKTATAPERSPAAEWPRIRFRNAVSRVGYINDADDTPATPGADAGKQEIVGSRGGSAVTLTQQTVISSHALSLNPGGPKGRREASRQRIQQMHLAVPNAM